MCDAYPRWDVTKFLNSDELACLYLKAAADDDTGSGDTIRLAWRDIQEAHYGGRLSINTATNSEGLIRLLKKHGVGDVAIRKITRALLMYGAIAA